MAVGGSLVNFFGVPTYDYGDERVSSVVALAPWKAFGGMSSGTSSLDVPLLTIAGGQDVTVWGDPADLYSHVTATPRAMGTFPEAGHMSFAPSFCLGWGNGCGPFALDEEIFTSALSTSVLAWLEALRGRPGAIEQLPQGTPDLVTWDLVE